MNLIRKVKISKIINVEFTEKETEIVDLTNRKLRYLTGYEYNDARTYYTNVCSEFIFEVCTITKKIYIQKDSFWDKIENEIGYINTQKFLSYMLKNRYEKYSDYYIMPKF